MEDNKLAQFLKMWGQTAGIIGLFFVLCLVVIVVLIGLAKLFAVAAPWVAAILIFVLGTLAITAWGWIAGERP